MQVTVPHLSPDGTKITFTGAKPGAPIRIYVVSAEGGNLEQLSHGADLRPTGLLLTYLI